MNNLLHHSKVFFKRNASTILTCVGGVGVVATAVMAVAATPKAMQLLEQAKEEKGEALTKLEVVKTAGPAYIPAAVTGVTTIACIFGANILNKRQQASLMSAYALLDNSYKDYRAKVVDLYGQEVDNHIKAEIAKDKYDAQPLEPSEDKQLYFDELSNRYFEAAPEHVQRAEYLLNKEVALRGYACVNNFYEFLDIPPVPGCDEIGWSSGKLQESSWAVWVDFEHQKVEIDDDLECCIIRFLNDPEADYLDY